MAFQVFNENTNINKDSASKFGGTSANVQASKLDYGHKHITRLF